MKIFKKKEIVLDCFTTDAVVYDNAKINDANKFMPEWWKNTPQEVQGDKSIRNCLGIVEFYRTGIVIPSWFEMYYKDGQFTTSTNIDTGGSHPNHQYQGFAGDDGTSMKLHTPWVFKCNRDINFTWTQPTWNNRDAIDRYTILPAVVNYKYQFNTSINLFMVKKEQEEGTLIKPLTPLVILHPMTEEKVVIKNHLVDEKEYQRVTGIDKLHFTGSLNLYNRRKKLINKVDELNCPYHK
jgi:hypothetical protein